MKTIDRLKQFIDKKGISLNAFDASIGAANGYVGKTIKNNGSIGSDMLEKIFSVYADLDPVWLLTGKDTGYSMEKATLHEDKLQYGTGVYQRIINLEAELNAMRTEHEEIKQDIQELYKRLGAF